MIVVRVSWDREPERLVGPFGKINEALDWIDRWKESMYLNSPDVSAKLVTAVLTDPVEGMGWATSPMHLRIPEPTNGDRLRISSFGDR